MSFFYTKNGDSVMKIYVDLILLLNFFLDFLLLLGVNLILKRNVKIIRIILGAIVGALSILALFININSLELFMVKVVISILMILISFGFKNVKYTFNNIVYLYLLSIILGGFLYFINDELSYKNSGLIFFNNGFSINWLMIILSSPIMIFMYVKQVRNQKENLSKYYEVDITFLNGKTKHLTGFLDTGNNLYDPYKKRPIIVIKKELLDNYKPRCILVPCLTINKESLLKCFRIKKIVINNQIIKEDVLVGISDNNFHIDGVDLLLNKKIIKGD